MEHALAGDGGWGIRMKDTQGRWVVVRGEEAKAIRREMSSRAAGLREELKQQGLHILGADLPVAVGDDRHSVDLRCWVSERGTEALVEAKWSRKSLEVALAAAEESAHWQRAACDSGKWVSRSTGKVGKAIKAQAFGALAVGPTGLKGTVTGQRGNWYIRIPRPEPPAPRRRASGWAAWRGEAAPGDPRWPSGASSSSGWPRHNAARFLKRLAPAAGSSTARKKPARA